MADKTVYVVKALAALVNLQGGFATLFHRGAVLPDNVEPDHLQHLVDNDLVEKGVLVGGLEPVYTGDLAEQLTSRGDGTEPEDDSEGENDEEPEGPPAKSASRADWDAYAKSEAGGSLTDEQIAAFSTKEDLQKHYGGV